MDNENPTEKKPLPFPPGTIPVKLTGFLCPHCNAEIKVADDIEQYVLPTPAQGVGMMFICHVLCHKPIPYMVVPTPPEGMMQH